jgi:hypothetical protein
MIETIIATATNVAPVAPKKVLTALVATGFAEFAEAISATGRA